MEPNFNNRILSSKAYEWNILNNPILKEFFPHYLCLTLWEI